jgi:putative transposase
LEALYPIVYLDALFVKMRHEGRVENRAVYIAIGVRMDGFKDVLGLWTADTEGPKFWLMVTTELRNRGVQDIFIACVDGLKGFPEAIEAVFPKTQVQLCIVHLIRNSLKYVGNKERKLVAPDLKAIYSAPTAGSRSLRTEQVRGKMGRALSSDPPDVGTPLGAHHSVLCVSATGPKSHLHHQRDRISEYVLTQDHQNAGCFSQ